VKTHNFAPQPLPHDHAHNLCTYHQADEATLSRAIDGALSAKVGWESMPWSDRAAIFLKAADLVSGKYRYRLMVATMLGQGKNVWQAEIDAAAELADFFRFGVKFVEELYAQQPLKNAPGIWNRVEYRALEGFVLTVSPFNFTAIGGNLPGTPTLVGNTVIWKPSPAATYSNYLVHQLLTEAGLPPGVIQFTPGPAEAKKVVDKELGTPRSNQIRRIPNLLQPHKILLDTPRTNKPIKNTHTPRFIIRSAPARTSERLLAHHCARALVIVVDVASDVAKPGGPCEEGLAGGGETGHGLGGGYIYTFVRRGGMKTYIAPVRAYSVNHRLAHKKQNRPNQRSSSEAQQKNTYTQQPTSHRPSADDSKGYFIQPTVILSKDPKMVTFVDEIFGPVITVFLFDDEDYEKTLDLIDNTTEYALTGAIFATSCQALLTGTTRLRNVAGNIYYNDKCTGAVVGQQPFGGARGSGTNDKAGSVGIFYRFVSARSIKENFVGLEEVGYPSNLV
ncbi:ALDH-like protein, partial [Tricholoma matsutake]